MLPSDAPPLADPAPGASTTAARWRLRLLGGFELDDGCHRMTRLRSRAAMALVARIALAPGRDHAREELAALLWPEADAEAGRSRLRQTLSLLRAVLEPPGAPPVLVADRRVLRAVPGALWCDATAFEAALQAGHADTAAALWRGELLPGFYDEWIVDERLRLTALHDRLADGTPHLAPAPPRTAPVPVRTLALPHYLTRLVGADQVGARLLSLVTAHRLVTVLGPGGVGKTRLAVEVAHLAAAPDRDPPPRFDTAAFVSLVDAVDRLTLFDRLLQALRLGGGGAPADQVVQALADRRVLLVLDNAEQLDDDATAALSVLAQALPAVHWLVTSRRPLELDGEHSFVLDQLPLPEPQAALSEVAMNPAVVLLVDRVRAHHADFHVNASRQAALVALVRWLDGLPLALELAATQMRTLGPEALLALLQEARDAADGGALDLLVRRGRRGGTDPRHASMRAVVDGSWRLLDPSQRAMLVALSLLPAGAPAGWAARLPAAEAWPRARAQTVLDALAAQSMLRAQRGADGQPRYAPYEPVREFALAQADATTLRVLRGRLLETLLDWARSLPETPPLPAVRDALPTLALALAHAGPDGRADDAARLVLLLQSSWGEIALPGGVLAAVDRLLDSPGLDEGLAAGCHALAATRHQEAGRPDDARRHRERALQRLAACPAPDPAVQVMVLGRAARLVWRLERDAPRARALIAQALPIARSAGRPNSEASLLSLQAHLCAMVDHDPARATELSAQALALWERSGNHHLINAGRFNLATNRMKAGACAEVLEEFAALARAGHDLEDWDLAAGALEGRGTALQGLRRWAESAVDLRESVRLAWEGMETMALAYALWNLPPALARLRLADLAAETMGAAEALWRARFGVFDAVDRRDLKRVRRMSRVLLGPQAAAAAWRRGAERPLAEAVRAVATAPLP
jgi:predicted ATPase